MSKVPFYQIDAFASEAFKGNPAALCIFQEWPDDKVLQDIAIENNLAETGYLVAKPDHYEIRWFTNECEINLCGHATLAAAHALYEHRGHDGESVRFATRYVGDLTVTRRGDLYVMDFPAWPAKPVECPALAIEGLGGATPMETYVHRDYMLVYDSVETIHALNPDFSILGKMDKYLCVTAPGKDCDFGSRFFCPNDAVREDPVTGSAHTMLAPFWAKRLGKDKLLAKQYSPRGAADVLCHVKGDRVELAGKAVTVITGEMILPLPPAGNTLHKRERSPTTL